MRYSLRLIPAILFISPLNLTAQVRTAILDGSLGVESGETFTYQLEITDSAGTLRGYARTFLKEANDTKAAVTGTIDRQRKTLTFAETGIVYNNGFRSNAIICLLRATLTYKAEGDDNVLYGPVASNDAGHAACSRGSVRFEPQPALEALFREEAIISGLPKDTVKRPPPVRVVVRSPAPVAPKAEQSRAPDQITMGVDKVYEWHTDTVILEIWDGGRTDNDMVSILFNGAPVLTRHILTKEKRKIILPLADGDMHQVTVIALNEGNEPPNTANILLHDGAAEHALVANNRIGKEAHIKIRKAPGNR